MEFLDPTICGFSSFRIGKPNYQGHSFFQNKVELITDGKGRITGVTNAEKLLFANVPNEAENVQVLEVGTRAFSGCTHLRSIRFSNNLEYVGREAFQGCTALESVELPDSLYELDESAFAKSGLKSFVVPKETTEIPSKCFEGCEKLRSLVFAGKLLELGTMSFSGCTSLESIDLGFSLKEIPDGCFMNSGLRSISLPHSLKRIGASALSRCYRLESIYFDGTVEDFRNIRFGMYWNRGLSEQCRLLVKDSRGLWVDAFAKQNRKEEKTSHQKQSDQVYSHRKTEDEMSKRLEILGLDHIPTMTELNSAFRKKAHKFHPDAISSLGLDQEFLDFASKKFRELNEAYLYVKNRI